MHNKICRSSFIAALLLASATSFANTIENFNSRPGVPVKQLRGMLQNSCWTFHQFDVNQNGWNKAIEGDGSMVSAAGALNAGNAGIYTPLLNVIGTINVSFVYGFNEDFSAPDTRWLKICLADANNNIVHELQTINIDGKKASKLEQVAATFKDIKEGEYRLAILYGGTGGSAAIAIDEFQTSAAYKFEGGCYSAPEAYAKIFVGEADRTAKGKLIETSGKNIYLERHPDNGRVDLFPDGTFVFIPDTGFKGKSTSFLYRVCSEGSNNLCSDPIVAKINFPAAKLVKFNGSYKSNGQVELAWNTEADSETRKFEVERSTDGRSWESAGIILAKQSVSNGADYTYIDKVGKNTALKKDIYYRLRQTDQQGEITTSNPMIVRVYNTRSLTMICVAPNPSKREIAVNVQLQEPSMVTTRVYDRSQNTVLHSTVEADEGVNNIVVEGSRDLIPGNYVLEVIVNSKERMLVKLTKE